VRAYLPGTAAAKPWPLTPNLLAETKALVRVTMGEHQVPLQHAHTLLSDGKADPPPGPWLSWSDVQMIDSGWRGATAVTFDTFRTQVRLKAVTFVEDPRHPHSWVRDALLQYWDAAREKWVDAQYLLADAAAHTHELTKPVESSRFRLVSSGGVWPVGNLRLAEVVFHGEALGPSHPDALAKRPVAVLFDEDVRDFKAAYQHGHNPGLRVQADAGAFAGSHYFTLDPGKGKEANAAPAWQPPFGHEVPHWDFEVAEKPGPGQYRFLQFACKALAKGAVKVKLSVAGVETAHSPGGEWQVYRVDLWRAGKGRPLRVRDLRVWCEGGPAAFDRVLLARSEDDLK
jgi:hypothetical protein